VISEYRSTLFAHKGVIAIAVLPRFQYAFGFVEGTVLCIAGITLASAVVFLFVKRFGIRLVRMDDCAQLCSSPDYADEIRKAFEIRKSAKLSQPALEVLTIIAYYQPTTRAYVDQVRGVDSSYTMGLLMERGLIEECGRLQVPGRPHLYRTTREFLRVFGSVKRSVTAARFLTV